ncbi:hypothetical protein L915_11617, partial [Phytophthora nicotianae]
SLYIEVRQALEPRRIMSGETTNYYQELRERKRLRMAQTTSYEDFPFFEGSIHGRSEIVQLCQVCHHELKIQIDFRHVRSGHVPQGEPIVLGFKACISNPQGHQRGTH